MNLVEEYRRQFDWRSWSDLVAALPPLAARGARVVGFDGAARTSLPGGDSRGPSRSAP